MREAFYMFHDCCHLLILLFVQIQRTSAKQAICMEMLGRRSIALIGRNCIRRNKFSEIGLQRKSKHCIIYCKQPYSKDVSTGAAKPVVLGVISRFLLPQLERMGYTMTVNDAQTQAIIHTPGLTYESFDKDGNAKMPSLLRFVTSARIYASHLELDEPGKTIFDWARLTSDRLTFVGSSEIITEKELYDPEFSKNPLDIIYQLGYVGSSSVSTVTTVISPSTGQTLFKNTNQLVGMDKQTRRPTRLPDWWTAKHKSSAIFKEPLVIPKTELSVKPFPYSVRVVWSQTDGYNHTNYASYVQYCIDALHHSIEWQSVQGIDKAAILRGVKTMRNRYIGESVESDELVIHVWVSESQDRTVHFDVQKWGNSIFQSTFVYHE